MATKISIFGEKEGRLEINDDVVEHQAAGDQFHPRAGQEAQEGAEG